MRHRYSVVRGPRHKNWWLRSVLRGHPTGAVHSLTARGTCSLALGSSRHSPASVRRHRRNGSCRTISNPVAQTGPPGRKWTLCADVTETRRMALRAPLAGRAGLFLETTSPHVHRSSVPVSESGSVGAVPGINSRRDGRGSRESVGVWQGTRLVLCHAFAVCALCLGVYSIGYSRRSADRRRRRARTWTLHAAAGTQLLGPYFRFGWNHPGPAYFYLALPIYELCDRRGSALNVFALLVDVIVVIFTVLETRKLRGTLFAFVVAMLLAILSLVGLPFLLTNQWNPILPILLLASCSSSPCGLRLRARDLAGVRLRSVLFAALSAGASSSSLRTDFLRDALEQAVYARCGVAPTDLIHHSDRARNTCRCATQSA
jgi:hypothetical protein